MSQRPSFLRFSILAAISLGLVFAQAPQPQTLRPGNADGQRRHRRAAHAQSGRSRRACRGRKSPIPEQDGTEVEYEGVPLREILKRAGRSRGQSASRQGSRQLTFSPRRMTDTRSCSRSAKWTRHSPTRRFSWRTSETENHCSVIRGRSGWFALPTRPARAPCECWKRSKSYACKEVKSDADTAESSRSSVGTRHICRVPAKPDQRAITNGTCRRVFPSRTFPPTIR